MRLLLDSHVVLWWLYDDPKLSNPARAAIASPANAVWVSAASAYELIWKERLGKLPLPLERELERLLERSGVAFLAVAWSDAARAAALPLMHRDPWDRLLVAQALEGGMTIVTTDPVVRRYGVPVLW